MLETHNKHVIVFDLDETLGCFVQFGLLLLHTAKLYATTHIFPAYFVICWTYIQNYCDAKIFSIIKYILDVKEEYNVTIMIYTNNQGPKEWVQLIKRYFEYKLNRPIFTKIIYAFMINGRVIEPKR